MRRELIRGTAWGVLGEGLALPTGFLTAAVLSRVFGPSDYGLYALAIGWVSLGQAGANFLLTRPTIKFASQAEDPHPITSGTPGLLGYSPVNLYYDNVTVSAN